jgi:hypothetical protein
MVAVGCAHVHACIGTGDFHIEENFFWLMKVLTAAVSEQGWTVVEA